MLWSVHTVYRVCWIVCIVYCALCLVYGVVKCILCSVRFFCSVCSALMIGGEWWCGGGLEISYQALLTVDSAADRFPNFIDSRQDWWFFEHILSCGTKWNMTLKTLVGVWLKWVSWGVRYLKEAPWWAVVDFFTALSTVGSTWDFLWELYWF